MTCYYGTKVSALLEQPVAVAAPDLQLNPNPDTRERPHFTLRASYDTTTTTATTTAAAAAAAKYPTLAALLARSLATHTLPIHPLCSIFISSVKWLWLFHLKPES
jgi:hypothetical protein